MTTTYENFFEFFSQKSRNWSDCSGLLTWPNKDNRKPPCKMTENGRGL